MLRSAARLARLMAFISIAAASIASAWAPVCNTGSAEAPMAVDMPGMPMPEDGPTDQPTGPSAPDCPWGPVGNTVSCLSFGLLAVTVTTDFSGSQAVWNTATVGKIMPTNLLVSDLFHPPKA